MFNKNYIIYRYLKSIFPKAEETLILDILANKDDNVQKASEELIGMGFTKKDTSIQKKKDKETPQPVKKVVTIMKTTEEKMQCKLYSDLINKLMVLKSIK